MGLDSIVDLSISATGEGPTQANFGTPLIAAYHTLNADLTRVYTSLPGLVADGFISSTPVYKIAAALKAQNPAITRFKVGRRATAYTQVVNFTPSTPANGTVYSVTINGSVASYTASGVDTVATVCTALATVITALPLVTATGASATHVAVTTDAAGTLASYTAVSSTLALFDATADPGIAADLDAIVAVDSDWYGLLLDSQGKAEAIAAAAWAESHRQLLGLQSADTIIATSLSDSTNEFKALKAASYFRTYGIWHASLALEWPAAAWMGDRFPDDPGSDTWAFKTLAGVTPDDALTETQIANILANNGNVYVTVAGVPVTYADFDGTTGRGARTFGGEFIDLVRGLDWLRSLMQTRIFALFVNSKKVPFTDAGIALVVGEIQASLDRGVDVTLLAADPKPTITAPKARDVSSVDKAARHLPGVTWSATAAGAIHAVTISGTVTQ